VFLIGPGLDVHPYVTLKEEHVESMERVLEHVLSTELVRDGVVVQIIQDIVAGGVVVLVSPAVQRAERVILDYNAVLMEYADQVAGVAVIVVLILNLVVQAILVI